MPDQWVEERKQEMYGFWQDVRFCIRNLKENPGFAMVVALSLGLAIAGNTIVFSLINGLLYRPMPYQNPDRILVLTEYEIGGDPKRVAPVSTSNFIDWCDAQTSFSSLALFRSQPGQLGTGPDSESIRHAEATESFFPLLGVIPWLGRSFDADDLKQNARVVLLTHAFWNERLDADSRIIGRRLVVNGESHAIIGILPEAFEFLDPSIDLWTPLSLAPPHLDRRQRSAFALARLKPTVNEVQARGELQALAEQLRQQHPEANRGFAVNTLNLRHDIPDTSKRQLFALLQGALIFVLLIACANIAHLLLARGQKRTREIALRACLGASSPRLLRQMLTESLVLAILGGGVGGMLGWAGIKVMHLALADQLPSFYAPVIDVRVGLFTLALAALCTLAFGLFPASSLRRPDHAMALKDGGHGFSLSRRRRMANQALVVAEITLALILLGGAAVLIRGFLKMQHTDPGFDTGRILTAKARLTDSDDPIRLLELADRAAEQLRSISGVAQVTISDHQPRTPALQSRPFEIVGRATASDEPLPTALQIKTTPTYLEALDLRLLRGRFFESTDRAQNEPIAVINQSLAERFWPGDDPIGQRIHLRGRDRRIVGLVSDVRHGHPSDRTSDRAIYLPWHQDPSQEALFVIRAESDPLSLADDVRRQLFAIDSRLLLRQVTSLDEAWAASFSGPQLFSAILSVFGALALFLATLGTYGVLAYLVAQRGREISIRLAMGARRQQVLAMVVRQGLYLGLIGVFLGLFGLWSMQNLIASSMADSAALEPLTAGTVAFLLLAVTLFASWLPARRAAVVDPGEVLRSE